ncbi:MAG TPA: hypothetical protein VM299_05020 [Solirubrobacteraceae bacterium]|nr:hypothetical protein [Solirubrobacteraceae bacterium]
MEQALATVVWVVAAVGVLVAIVTLAGTARSYGQIGGGGLTRDSDATAPPSTPAGAAAPAGADAERDEEIRQMLDARNARRARRGEAPLDVEAELAALRAPQVDPGLREEVRQLVVARNERRVRSGQDPLDVEAETERRIRDLT